MRLPACAAAAVQRDAAAEHASAAAAAVWRAAHAAGNCCSFCPTVSDSAPSKSWIMELRGSLSPTNQLNYVFAQSINIYMRSARLKAKTTRHFDCAGSRDAIRE